MRQSSCIRARRHCSSSDQSSRIRARYGVLAVFCGHASFDVTFGCGRRRQDSRVLRLILLPYLCPSLCQCVDMLIDALEQRQEVLVDEFLRLSSGQVPPRMARSDGITPLHAAANTGHVVAAELLLVRPAFASLWAQLMQEAPDCALRARRSCRC